MNLVKNTQISLEDMDLVNRIFGKDVATWKGKWITPEPPVLNRNDIIELLNIRGREVDLTTDVVVINSEAFLHAVD